MSKNKTSEDLEKIRDVISRHDAGDHCPTCLEEIELGYESEIDGCCKHTVIDQERFIGEILDYINANYVPKAEVKEIIRKAFEETVRDFNPLSKTNEQK